MKPKDFMLAIEICTEHHSNEVIINKSFGHASNTGSKEAPTLHIKHCVASVVNKLIAHGFSLSMDNGFLSVDKY